jgi:hypothetical protein
MNQLSDFDWHLLHAKLIKYKIVPKLQYERVCIVFEAVMPE